MPVPSALSFLNVHKITDPNRWPFTKVTSVVHGRAEAISPDNCGYKMSIWNIWLRCAISLIIMHILIDVVELFFAVAGAIFSRLQWQIVITFKCFD